MSAAIQHNALHELTALLKGGAATPVPWQLRLDKLSGRTDTHEMESARSDALQDAVTSYRNAGNWMETQVQRRLAWLVSLKETHGPDCRIIRLTSASALALQLGRSSIWVNSGMSAEHISGVPWIPGTGWKGTVSSWAAWTAHALPDNGFREMTENSLQRKSFQADDAKLARLVLGDDSGTGSDLGGTVRFLGGWPGTVPQLQLDIVNPHHEPSGASKANLTPNHFLTLAPGVSWYFCLLVPPGTENAGDLLDAAERWTKEALTELGTGAKTAADYGRFRLPSPNDSDPLGVPLRKAEKAAEEHKAEESLAALSPEERAWAEFSKGKTADVWNGLARNIASLSDADRLHVFRYFSTPEGQSQIQKWKKEKGDKAQQRIKNLQAAGFQI